MEIARIISVAIMWICIGIYIYLIWSNLYQRDALRESIQQLEDAKKRCDDAAQKLKAALDALQREGVGAALAMFEKEDVE